MFSHVSMRSINRTIALAALGLGLTGFAAPSADAAVIVSSDLTRSTDTKALITAVDPNVTVSEYYEAFGGTVISGDNNHYFGRLDGSSSSRIANREMVETIDAAVENEIYGTFTIDVADGMQLSLTSLTIGMQINSDTATSGTFWVHLRSSADDFASDIALPVSLAADGAANTDGIGTFDLTALAGLTGETTFNLYMVLNNLPTNPQTKYIRIMPDIVLEGEVAPIPEPAMLGLVGLGGLLVLRRRRAQAGA